MIEYHEPRYPGRSGAPGYPRDAARRGIGRILHGRTLWMAGVTLAIGFRARRRLFVGAREDKPSISESAGPVTTAISAAQVANATITGVFPESFTFDDGARRCAVGPGRPSARWPS